MNATRIVVLPDDRGLILGKVIGDKSASPLKPRMIYEIVEVLGELIIKEVGEYALPKMGYPSEGSDVNAQVSEIGKCILTPDELNALINASRS